MFPFSQSEVEGGPSAGPDTWRAALNGPRPLLNTPEEFQAMRDLAKSSGGWEDEIADWEENEIQASFLKLIAGDVRNSPGILEGVIFEEKPNPTAFQGDVETFWQATCGGIVHAPFSTRSEAYQAASNELVGWDQQRRASSLSDIDWLEFEAKSQAGIISGNIFRFDDGQIFYTLKP